MPPWIDTHCHLDASEFDGDRDQVRERARAAGVTHCVLPAVEAGNFAIELVYNWGKDDAYAGGDRFGHFAFETADIDSVLPVLELFGGRVTRQPFHLEGSGTRIAFVDDPDGNSVELIQR